MQVLLEVMEMVINNKMGIVTFLREIFELYIRF